MKQAVALGSGELEKELNQAAKEAPARRAAQGLAPYPEQTNQFNPSSAASMEAAIWDGTDGKARDDMYAGMDALYDDPSSPYYNQYRKPTNTQYTDPLKKYGLEVPDIITADWINEQWSQYGKYLPTNAAGTSASLPKKHTKEQEIAFSLYQLNAIEYTTQKAEKELADIRDKVTWYAQHGYSQDYIAKVIGSEKHSTLDSLNITRDPNAISQFDDDGYNISTKQGTAVQLNRSVYFDNDILTGMYWKALNGADDVDDFTAAVYAYQNKGKLTGGSKRLDDMRTYGSPNYNPHNDGCTNIDAKMAFGQDEFTYEDLKRLRAETDPFDTTKQKLLDKLFDNETRTANAEKELAWLNGRVSGFNYNVDIPEGKDPRKYFEERVDSWLNTGGSDAEGLSNLKTMDKRREQGNPMDINRSINYRKEDVVDAMMARYNATHGITTDPRAELAPKQPETSQSKTAGLNIPEPPVKPAEEGNIDIDNRQVVQNEDGTFSTEESFSTNIDGMEVLLPTIINGKRVSEDEAIAHYMETGENLGKFKTVEDAEAYAEWLHNRQEKVYGEQAEPEQTEPEQVEQPPKKDDSVYNVQVGGHYVQVPAYDKDGNRMTEEEAMQAYIDSRNGGSSDSRTAPAEPAPQTDTFRTYERRDDKEMQDWVDSHTTDSFNPNFVMKVPSGRGNWAGTVAAGGAVSDQPTWYKGKNDTRPQEVYVVTDKEGAQEFTSADLLHIMNAAYSGKGDQLSEEERRMGEGLINSIPWAFGDSLQWLGTNGEFDSGAMKRMDDTARALGEDLRNIRDAASSYYATSGEKADIAVRFFEDALSAANAGKTIAEWYDQTEEGQQRKQELLDEAAGINQRADEIKAENDEKERQAKREALAINLTIMQASPDQLDENGKAAADQMTLRLGEADSILAMPEAKDTWNKEGRAFVDYVDANFGTPYIEALDNDDPEAAQAIVRRFMGLPEDADVSGISEDMFYAEQEGLVEVAKQLYAQDAKIAMASGMTLEEYYETVGHRNAEDLMHASFQYRQLMNSEDSISEEAKQGIGVLATVWNGMKLGAVDVASSDVGFAADIANILTSPGDFTSLSTRYTNRYGFFQGRSQYRNDVDTMLAWWESQDDEASQQKAAEYREKMKLIDANGLDIFNLGFNPDTDLLERVRKQVNDEIAATQDWIDEYATDAEKHGVQIIRSATGSTIQQTRAMALSAVTGIPTGLATTMSFLPGSFEGHMQDTEGRGWSDTRRYMYAMIGGLMDAALEGEFSSKYYNVGGDALSGFLKDGATKFAATHGITGLGSHLVYGLMVYAGNSVGEITQEVLQNVAGGIYDYMWTGNDEMLRDSVARDTMVDTILSTALSTFMSTTAHQAGQAANGAPSIFSNRYRITTAAMLEFSPELREAAHELFSAGSIYNRGDDVLDLVTEGSRQSAMTRAGEIGEVVPNRSMPEPTQASEMNSARSVTEEGQTTPEQGPQIPAEAAETQTEQVEQPAAPVEEAPTEAPTAEPKTEAPVAPAEEAPVEAPVEEAPAEAPVAEPQIEQLVDETQNTTEERTVPEQAPELPPQATKPERRTWYREARRELQNLKAAAERESTREVLPESLKYKSEDEIDDVRQGLTAEADTGRIVNAVSSRVKASVLDVYKKAYKQTGIRVGWCKDSIKEAKNLFSEYKERLSYRVGSKNLGDIAAQAKDYADRTGTGKAGESEQFQKLINASEGVDKAVALAEKWDKPLEDLSKKLDYFIGHELGKLDGTWFLQDVIPDLPKQLTEGLSTASPFTLRETADVLSSDDADQFDLIAGISEACKKVYAQFDADVHSVASGFDEAVSEFTSALKHYTKAYIAEASGEKFSDAVIDHGYALPITEAVKLERDRLERAETVLSHQADALAEMLNSAPEKLKQDLSNAVAPAYTNPQRLLIDPENETLSTLNRAIDNRREEINSRLYIERQEDEAAKERESDAGNTSEQVSNLSPEMQLFVEKAGAWFRDAKTQLADLMNRAADQNITEEQKATLDHQIQTIQSRITDASFEIMDRLTKMDIHLKTAELMRNPEAVAQMVKFTADKYVSSKIAAGALTAKPATKEKLRAKLEAAEAADAANKAAADARATAQQAGAAVTAARDTNRENPTPENAQKEIDAVKKKVDADKKADEAQKAADTANATAQKTEEDLNKDLQSNLEALRQEGKDVGNSQAQKLQQTVGDSLDTALEEDSVTKVDLPPIDPEVTVNQPEAQTPVKPQTEGPAPDLQERLNTLKSRLQNLNTDGKNKLNGNRYLTQAIVDAAAADANVENYLTGLDDAGIQNLLRQSKAAGITKGKAAAWLRGLVRDDAAARGVTIEADAYTEAKDNLKAATESVVGLKLVPAAQLIDPARTVQTVLTEQYQQLSALKKELETAQRNGTDPGDLPDRIKAARTEIATTMDAASVVLRHWDKGPTKYMGTSYGAFEALDKETWSGSRAAQSKADRFDSTATDILTDINNLVTNGSKVVPGKSDGFHDYRMPYQLPRAGVERRNAPTGTQQPGAFNPPSRSPIEIFQKLGNDLGIGTYSSVRNMPQGHNVPATTDERRGYILSARYHSNEAWALYHEIGHNIQERTQMATTQDMINNMDPATRAQYTGAELNAEAYAEFVASYVSGTANAFYAPNTVSDFENSLRRAGIYRQVQEARTAQAAYGTATPLERIAAHMKYENHRDERPTATGQAIRNAMRKVGIGMVDDTMAAARFDTASGLSRNDSLLSIQQQAKLMKGDAQRATQLIVGNLTTLGGRYLREGFADATEGFTEEQLRMTDAYMSAVHALDRANVAIQRELSRVNNGLPRQQWRALTANETQHALEQAQVFNPTYNSLNDIQNAIDTTQRNHPEVVAAADQRISWWHDFMQEYAVNTHLLTQNQLDTMERDYPHYAPMYRVGREGGDLFHELTGSDRDIMAPTVGYVHNINAIVERGRRNAVLESIYNELLSEPDGDGLGLFVRVADGNEAANTTSFTDATGETHYLQFEDEDLFKMITSNATPAQVRGGLRGVAKLTRAMAMFTTGSNPLFAAKNFVRDFQQGVNHGSWAATYLDGAAKWIISGLELAGSQLSSTRLAQRIAETNFAANTHLDNAIDRMANRSRAAEYRALNGSDEYTHHGLPRGERKILTTDADQLLSMFTTDTESRPKKLWNTAWNLLTFDAVNGWVEQTTRFAEYRFGRHDLDTEVGRQKAYLAAQESTTNFALSGNSQLAADLRAVIPFFNATLQGTYSALHSFSEAERDRLPARITKTIVNNVLMGALAYELLEKYGSDDDKEWYEKLAEGLKTDNIIIPFGALENFLGQDAKEHPRQFIRIPLTQNPFGKLFYNVGRLMLHDKIGGESLMDLTGVVQAILSEATQLDPITNPLVNVWMNKTYYGSNIVPNYLLTTYDGKKIPPVEHTNDSTAYAFEVLARIADQIPFFNNGVTNDPMKMQYLFQQYTGFIGKLAIPFFTGTRATGYNSGGAEVAYNLMDILRKDWTADAAYSNDFNDAFHDYEEAIESIVSYGGSRGKAPGLNQLLSQEEQQEALDVGTYLTGPTGPLTVLGEEISDLYNQQSKIYENEALSYDDRQIQARDIQKMIVNKQIEGLAICKEYASKYMGQTFSMDYALYGAKQGLEKNPTASFPRVLDATKDGKHPGMQRALEVYKRADSDPNMTASYYNPSPYAAVQLTKSTKVPLYAMPTACAEQYQDTFVESIETSLGGVDWDSMTPGEQETVVKKAVSTAKTAARKAVLSYYDLNGLMPTD